MDLSPELVLALVMVLYLLAVIMSIIVGITQTFVAARTRKVPEFKYFSLKARLMAVAGFSFLIAFTTALVNAAFLANELEMNQVIRLIGAGAFISALTSMAASSIVAFLYWNGSLWIAVGPSPHPNPHPGVLQERSPSPGGVADQAQESIAEAVQTLSDNAPLIPKDPPS